MRKNERSLLWVVYRMTMHGKPSQMNAVCEQGEWDAMERAQPGHHMLVRAGITNEGEAERLARSGSVDGNTSKPLQKTRKVPKRLTAATGTNEESRYLVLQPEKLVLLDRAV